jgi:hypothetical protein
MFPGSITADAARFRREACRRAIVIIIGPLP